MAGRIRSIKPEFFSDETIAGLVPLDQIVFLGLLGQADAAGRLEDRPARIGARLFGYGGVLLEYGGPRVPVDLALSIDRLIAAKLITRYTAPAADALDGARVLLEIRNFLKHQKPHPKEKILYPGPGDPGSSVAAGAGAGIVGLVAGGAAHRGHAVCGRVCLPTFLCDQFAAALGGADAPVRVRSWASALLRDVREDGAPIADAPVDWWRARWREYVSVLAEAGAPRLLDKVSEA